MHQALLQSQAAVQLRPAVSEVSWHCRAVRESCFAALKAVEVPVSYGWLAAASGAPAAI